MSAQSRLLLPATYNEGTLTPYNDPSGGCLAFMPPPLASRRQIPLHIANYYRLTPRPGLPNAYGAVFSFILWIASIKGLEEDEDEIPLVPTVGLATTPTGTIDIYQSVPATGLIATGQHRVFVVEANSKTLNPGGHVYLRVPTAATATEYLVDCDVFGFLKPAHLV